MSNQPDISTRHWLNKVKIIVLFSPKKMMSNMVGETSAEFLDSRNAKRTFDDPVLNAFCGLLVCGRRF